MSDGFETNLKIVLLDDSGPRAVYRLIAPLVFKIANIRFEVPTFFVTDCATVPRIPIIYDLWGDRAHRESVLHDYLYRASDFLRYPRKACDKIFLLAMQVTGKPAYIRYPMYWGVRLMGWRFYR